MFNGQNRFIIYFEYLRIFLCRQAGVPAVSQISLVFLERRLLIFVASGAANQPGG